MAGAGVAAGAAAGAAVTVPAAAGAATAGAGVLEGTTVAAGAAVTTGFVAAARGLAAMVLVGKAGVGINAAAADEAAFELTGTETAAVADLGCRTVSTGDFGLSMRVDGLAVFSANKILPRFLSHCKRLLQSEPTDRFN